MGADNGVQTVVPQFLTPVMSGNDFMKYRRDLWDFIKLCLTEGVDYGPPYKGADSLMLYEIGAESLMQRYGLVAVNEIIQMDLDPTGVDHDGEAFYYMCVRVRVTRDGEVKGEGIGAASTWEKKHRTRKAGRICPSCGKEAIISTSKRPDDWWCNTHLEGCGVSFPKSSPEGQKIERQETGMVINDASADLINTILKNASKRAMVEAVIRATGAGFIFSNKLRDGHKDAIPVSQRPAYLTKARSELWPTAKTVVAAQPVQTTTPPPVEPKPEPKPEPEPKIVAPAPSPAVAVLEAIVRNEGSALSDYAHYDEEQIEQALLALIPDNHARLYDKDGNVLDVFDLHAWGYRLFGEEWIDTRFPKAFSYWEQTTTAKTVPAGKRRTRVGDHTKLTDADALAFYTWVSTSLTNRESEIVAAQSASPAVAPMSNTAAVAV